MNSIVCEKKLSLMKRCTKCKEVYYCSKVCQIQDWPSHRLLCKINPNSHSLHSRKDFDLSSISELQQNSHINCKCANIIVKCNRKKYAVNVTSCGKTCLELISKTLCIPLPQLKLIAKGKVVTQENVVEIIFENNIKMFMAFGEQMEDETGLTGHDISVIMKQLNISRNTAIKGLRKCNNNVVDAILYIGDKL